MNTQTEETNLPPVAEELSLYEKLFNLNKQLAVHFKKHWVKWVMLMVLAYSFQAHYIIGLNLSHSLPGRFFLIAKGESVQKGQLVAFRWHGQGGFYVDQKTFTKIVKGVEGDVVTVDGDRKVFINGEVVATAKDRSSTGKKMEIIAPTVIGKGEIYVYAPHELSLDSRYADVGLIQTSEIIGRAYPIF